MIEDIRKTLLATADKLRANMDAAEYKHIVLGLTFVKYISDTFQTRREELTRRFADPADDYFLHDVDAELLAEELEDRDYYKEVNVFWVPGAVRWETLRAQVKRILRKYKYSPSKQDEAVQLVLEQAETLSAEWA